MRGSQVAVSRVVSVEAFANATGVSTRTVQRLIQSGGIQAVRIGRRVVIPVSEIDRVLAGGASTNAETVEG